MSYSKRLAVCESFKVRQPDADGIVWLEINAGAKNAMFNIGHAGTMMTEIAFALENDRKAAIESDDDY